MEEDGLTASFRWAKHACQHLLRALGFETVRATALTTARCFGSHCSGSGAAELALLSLESCICLWFVRTGFFFLRPFQPFQLPRLKFIEGACAASGIPFACRPVLACVSALGAWTA